MTELTGDYRKFMDKNFFGSWDIPDGGDLVVTIDHAEVNDVQNERGTEKKLTVHLVGYKPLICNATNGDAISKAVGSKNVENWAGKKIALYKEAGKWFGKTGEATRVRPEPPKDVKIKCEECGKLITGAYGMDAAALANYAEARYGRKLCASCAEKQNKEA